VRRMNGQLIGVWSRAGARFPARNMATTEAALMSRGASQLYLSLGDPNPDGTVPVRLYFKPNVLMIWLGALIMFFGGALSLSDRRCASARPRPAKVKDKPSATLQRRSDGVEILCMPSRSCWRCSARPRRGAVQPDEMLANPAQEARARALSKELRCIVCQNESIDDSEAPLAHDLRVLVRERIKDGDSDAQVIDFLVARLW